MGNNYYKMAHLIARSSCVFLVVLLRLYEDDQQVHELQRKHRQRQVWACRYRIAQFISCTRTDQRDISGEPQTSSTIKPSPNGEPND